MKAKTKGAVMATAVAMLFMATTAMGQELPSASARGASTAKVKCVGANACKGQSSCKGAHNDCKGQNACKGKGFIETSSAKECTDKGGQPQAM